jgi:hypothetical protein
LGRLEQRDKKVLTDLGVVLDLPVEPEELERLAKAVKTEKKVPREQSEA